MIIPVRCFTCGKVIGDLWPKYIELIDKYNSEDNILNKKFDDNQLLDKEYTDNTNSFKDTSQKKAMDFLKLERYCCRRHFLCHVDIIPTQYGTLD